MAITVTATQGTDTFNGIALAVRVYTGAAESGGASNTFHVSPGTGPAAVSLTPNASNSLLVFSTSIDTNNTFTAAASNAYDNNSAAPFGVGTGDGHYTGTVTSGVGVTLGSSAPTISDHYNCAGYEIRPSGGSTPVLDGSGPAWATTSTAITVTTASFTPPPGSVLVALIESFASGAGSGQTMTVSDTSGLVWTQRAGISFANQSEACFIFTATVPAAAGATPARPAPWWKPGRLPGLPLGTPFWLPPQDAPVPAVAAPAAVTPAPLVAQAAATPGFGQPNAGLTSRNSLADAPVLTTPAPLVVTPLPVPPPAAVTVVTRGAAQDPADFRGRQPVIAVPQPTAPAPAPPVISAAPFIPAAAPAQATPAPLVAWTQPPPVPPQQALTSRSSLADPPVLTTPAPVVVMATAVTGWGKPQAAVITASPAPPAAAPAAVTPQPVVVAQAVKAAAAQPPVIGRNTLADPPVLTTPRPVVVMTQVRPPPTTVISGAPFIPPPPPFSIGALTAADAASGVLTAAGASSALTAATAAQGTLTATDQRTGGPGG